LASALPLLGAPNHAIDPAAALEPCVARHARRLYLGESFRL
jgi:hypothetical protein